MGKAERQRWTKRWRDPGTESHRYICIWMYLRERDGGGWGGRARRRKVREGERDGDVSKGMEQNRGRTEEKGQCDVNKDANRETEGLKGSLRLQRESMSQIQGTERQEWGSLRQGSSQRSQGASGPETSTDPDPRSTLHQRSCPSPDPSLTSSSLLWGELCQAVLLCTGLLLHPLQGPFISFSPWAESWGPSSSLRPPPTRDSSSPGGQ